MSRLCWYVATIKKAQASLFYMISLSYMLSKSNYANFTKLSEHLFLNVKIYDDEETHDKCQIWNLVFNRSGNDGGLRETEKQAEKREKVMSSWVTRKREIHPAQPAHWRISLHSSADLFLLSLPPSFLLFHFHLQKDWKKKKNVCIVLLSWCVRQHLMWRSNLKIPNN